MGQEPSHFPPLEHTFELTLCTGMAHLRRGADMIDRLVVHVCRQDKPSALARLLRDGGGRANARAGGESALEAASRNGHLKCIELLLDAGADMRMRQRGAPTPLMLTIIYRHTCSEQLLRQRAETLDPWQKHDVLNSTWRGRTAEQLSQGPEHIEAAHRVLSAEASGDSTLIRAASAATKILVIGGNDFAVCAATSAPLSELPVALGVYLSDHDDSIRKNQLPRVDGTRLRMKAGVSVCFHVGCSPCASRAVAALSPLGAT